MIEDIKDIIHENLEDQNLSTKWISDKVGFSVNCIRETHLNWNFCQLPDPQVGFLFNGINMSHKRKEITQLQFFVHFSPAFFIKLLNITNDPDFLTFCIMD
jgi:hypothetical protein